MSTGPDMSEYLGMFLEEAEEQVETFDDGLLRLEEKPDDSELLQEIFRAAHSLKSSSAAMGFASMSRLCHASENVLDKFRSGAMRPDTEVIDALLAAVDALKTMKETIRAGGGDELDVVEVIGALERAADEGGAGAQGGGKEAKSRASGLEDGLSCEEGRRVIVRLSADCGMPAVRWEMAVEALASVGRVIRCEPSEDEVRAGRLGREFTLVAAEAEEAAIREALGRISEVESVEVCGAEEEGSGLGSGVKRKAADERAVDVGPSGRGKSTSELGAMARRGEPTVRVSVARLDSMMNLVGELVIDRTRLVQLGMDLGARHGGGDLGQGLRETCQRMARTVSDLQEEVMKARMLPIAQLFRRFPRMVRDLAHKMDKEVELILEGEETELDRSVIEEMVDPLGHLLRNAVDHGVEAPEERARAGKPRKGRIILAARQEENHIIIEITDDGAGIDVEKLKDSAMRKGILSESAAASISETEALQLVFSSGLSTSKCVSEVSGRGVGMDVVKTNVQQLRGRVQIQSRPGVGTTMVVRLPLTLAISQALLVKCGEETIAIPLVYVVETTRVARDALRSIRRRLVITFRGRVLPVVDLRKALEGDDAGIEVSEKLIRIVVARSGEQDVGMIVDHLVGEQEIVLKSLGSMLGDIAGLSGATILGDGTVALVLDVSSLMDRVGLRAALLAEDEGQPSGRRQFDGRGESDV